MAKAGILNDLASSLGIKIYKLEAEIGVSNGTIGKAISNNSDISLKIIEKITAKYPRVNREWLLTGEGNMYNKSPFRDAHDLGAYNDDDPTEVHRGKEYIDLGNGNYLLYTPLVPFTASMGYLHGYADPQWLEELPKHAITVDYIPRGIYRTFIGRGDSMDDGTKSSISNNDKVTGRVINKEYWTSKLHLHKYRFYIIVHKEGITIKEITEHDVENGIITIHSLNPDKKQYPDMQLHLKDVFQLLNVIKVERDL